MSESALSLPEGFLLRWTISSGDSAFGVSHNCEINVFFLNASESCFVLHSL